MARDRRVPSQFLDPVDQAADAFGFVNDQLGQGDVLGLHAGLEELGGAADAGQGVLDLVRQHPSEAADGAQALGVQGTPRHIGAVGLQGQEHRAIRQGGGDQVSLEGPLSGEGELDVPFPGRGRRLHRPCDQGVDLLSARQGVLELRARQKAQALSEQGLGRLVGGAQLPARADDQRRLGAGFKS